MPDFCEPCFASQLLTSWIEELSVTPANNLKFSGHYVDEKVGVTGRKMSSIRIAAALLIFVLGFIPASAYPERKKGTISTPDDVKNKCVKEASYLTESLRVPELERFNLIDFAKFPIREFLDTPHANGLPYQCNPRSCGGDQSPKACVKNLFSYLACFTYQQAYS